MKRILFCASEVFPFAKTGGLADVCGTLPVALEKLGCQVSIFMPKYASIREDQFDLQPVEGGVFMATVGKNIKVYFIQHHHFYDRDGLYNDGRGEYHDNLERFQFLCWRTLEVAQKRNLAFDVIHCHDWQTALIPVYMKHLVGGDPFFQGKKTVLTIHNLAFQGNFDRSRFARTALPDHLFYGAGFEFYGKINLLKAGLLQADMLTTVSPQYAREIQAPQHGWGLDGVLRTRQDRLRGILNGLDEDVWNPATDPYLDSRYSAADLAGKMACKRQLQQLSGLPQRDDVPVFGFVGRLSQQKGIDLILQSLEALLGQDVQVVFLGIGEGRYHQGLNHFSWRYPQRMKAHLTFQEKLAHLVYAGSDFFLMPSSYEPCGLSQMISLHYGTVPIVHRTGGLADTIHPFAQGGNGFVFSDYRPAGFLGAVHEALAVYHDQPRMRDLVARAFCSTFSWDRTAREYGELYQHL